MTHYLLDTNILLRSRDIASPDYNLVDRTIRYLISNNHRCFITSQVLIEFWVVATRPGVGEPARMRRFPGVGDWRGEVLFRMGDSTDMI